MVRFEEDGGETLAPVTPIFGVHEPAVPVADAAGEWNVGGEREAAEAALLKRLRTRQLSVAEARALLIGRELPGDQCEEILDDCVRRGYLDDARLAEQLIHAAVTRKGQGRRMIAQALSKRLIARDVIDAAIAELPDDDDDRALEFARTKARALVRYDDDVALRRLLGALARRGFGGSSAGSAARTALAEARAEAAPTGVRFR